MSTDVLTEDLITDLLRSAWIIERARGQVLERFATEDPDFKPSAGRAASRAEVVGSALSRRGREPDHALVDGHVAWIENLVGSMPGEVPLGDLLLIRLGDWVEGHASAFVDDGDLLKELGDLDRAAARFPDSLPSPPPFERLDTPQVDAPGPVRFSFGILGDLHIGSAHGESMARAAIADLNASGVELVIQLGDITDHGDQDEFETAAHVIQELRMPVVTMMGNHDVFSMKEERLSGREYYPVSFGREPDGVIVEHQGFRFVVLDSAENAASPFGPFDMVSGAFLEGSGGAIVRGGITPPQHELLAQVAGPQAGPAFVFLHHPVQPFTGFPPLLFGLREADSGRLHATCDSGNVWGVFAGHTHRCAITRYFDHVPCLEVGIARDYPFGYAIVDVADEGYTYRFLQISDDALLRDAYSRAGTIMRRYGAGPPAARAFSWRKP